nr:MAG TPA: hypothetical protein [Caudoviricetes sp.]
MFNPIVIKTFLDVATTNTWSPTVLNRIAVGFFFAYRDLSNETDSVLSYNPYLR